MSRYFNSFMDNSSEALEHSWGTSPKAKAREKEYNHWYYQKHKDEIAAIRKQRSAATNSYKQAEKSYNDARRYNLLADKIDYRIRGYQQVGPTYEAPDGTSHTIYKFNKYSGRLNANAEDSLNNAKNEYKRKSMESDIKSMNLRRQGDSQKDFANSEAKRIIRAMKNPSAKELAEFYLDTTVAKAKKAANKAKKYATKAMSTAKKYATEAMSTADKYATKAMSTAEKSARKAKKYATKTIKSVVR